MADDNGILSLLNNRLSTFLNKDVNENLTKTIINFYKNNNSIESFHSYLKVLGLVDLNKCQELYNLISDNIYIIEEKLKDLNPNTGIENHTIKKRKSNSASSKSSKKSALKLSFDADEDSDINSGSNFDISFKKSDKKNLNKPKLSFDEDDELLASELPIKEKPKVSFKKIKKEDAIRLKDEGDHVLAEKIPTSASHSTKKPSNKNPKEGNKKALSLAELSMIEKESAKTQEIHFTSSLDLSDEINIENDREWYLADEFEHNVTDYVDDVVDIYTPKQKNRRRNNSDSASGGFFDSLTGEYIDFDHVDSQISDDLSRIPINSHYFIPPFLESSKDELILQIGGTSSFSKIGPTINPVKDPNSELAISAKQGSFIVKDKKSKNERAQQAKDNSKLAGTSLGNVLGIQDNSQDKVNDGDSGEDSAEKVEQLSISLQRRTLPAFAVRGKLMQTINENQVTIVIGETGSGKTTQLTQYLYEEGFAKNMQDNNIRKIIGCTQPRRVAAMSVAKRVSEEMNCQLGSEVGYSIRFEDRTNPTQTMIKYMTEGVLLREILVDPNLEHYSCIIMDEAHERSLNTDVLLGLFKQLLTRRKDLKLIVTSATMNAERFSNFFGNAPQFTIPGRTFPVDVLFSKSSCQDFVESAVKQALTIHLQNTSYNDGDILIFMTGQEDIEITCGLLQEKLDLLDQPPPLDIIPIYSTMPADLQKKIFNKTNSKKRKVVVATNIAETSLTVDGIKYVIDTGLVKQKVYNPKLGMDTLQVIPISLANAQQRSGRAGRTGPGIAYRLYTEKAIDKSQMYMQPIPEIQRTNLSNVMLLLKTLKVDDISSFAFLDAPPKDLLNYSLYDLWSIGALDNFGNLTNLGSMMSKFPMESTLSKLILLSCRPQFHCSEDIVTIVAMLSVPSVYYRPKERANEADMVREKFMISESDHLTLLNIFNQWETNFKKFNKNYNRINTWCNKNFLQGKSLLRAKDIKTQILLIMQKNKQPILKSKSDDDIRKCLCASFYQQSAKLTKINVNGSSEFINLRHNYMKMYLHPTSALINSNLSSCYVIYHELILTTKEYMNYVTTVDPLWLLEFGYLFYDVAQSYKYKLKKLNLNFISKDDLSAMIAKDNSTYKEMMASSNRKIMSNEKSTKSRTLENLKRRRAF